MAPAYASLCLPSELVSPPRVAESAFQMECKLSHKHEIMNDKGEHTTTAVFGRIVRFHVAEALVRFRRGLVRFRRGDPSLPEVKFEGYQPMARMGGDTFVAPTDGKLTDIPRPLYPSI